MWFGSKYRAAIFAWLCMHLTLAQLIGWILSRQFLKRHKFSFFVSKKPFKNFLSLMTGCYYFIISTTFVVAIVSIIITITIIVNFIIFFRFLTSKSNVRMISFICSYNITIVIFRGWKFIIRFFFVFAIIIIIVIFIIIIIVI